MARTVLVMGAQGTVGRFIAEGLAESGWQVTRGGRRPEEASDFRQIDLADEATVAEAVRDFSLVVNTAHHPDLNLEKSVLGQGGTIIELAELNETERAALGRITPRGLVVTEVGLGGIGYLAVADLLREHPNADGADYALMFSASGSTGRAGALLAHGLLTGSAHHETTTVPFPAPVGERRCLDVGPDKDGVLRPSVAGVPLRHCLCMQPRPLHAMLLGLNAGRLISRLPRALFTAGTGKAPKELSTERVCEWVAVNRDGVRLASRSIEGEGYYRLTAAATVVLADALAGSRETGLRTIEELVNLGELAPALEKHGITVRTHAGGGQDRERTRI